MYKIYLDTTTRFNKKLRIVKILETKHPTEKDIELLEGDFDVIPTIKQLLKKHKIEKTNILEFIPNTGPGDSFTGIKKGVTAANILNWALKLKKLEDSYHPNYGAEPNIQQ